MSELQNTIKEDIKDAMRAKDRPLLGVLRTMSSEFKRVEIDERIELDDTRVLIILDKMVKQRRDSAKQYADNDRQDLADTELFEIGVIQAYLPEQLTEDEIKTIVADTAASLGAASMADMGKLMGAIKPKVQGRADMGAVGKVVKAQLNS